MKIEIYPLEKVVINGVSIYLGMDQESVENTIGKGEPGKGNNAGKRYYYYDTEMAVDYDSAKKVEFIEFLAGTDGICPVIYGVSAFDVHADELTKLLTERNNGEIGDWENGYSYGFLEISVGIYRDVTPESVNEMIEERKADGTFRENDEDIEFERRRASHWATIGIGVKDYYRK